VEERFPLQRGWRGVFSPWRKKWEGIRKLLEIVSSLYDHFFAIGDRIGEVLKLLLGSFFTRVFPK
jgi:hypothetical protein